ATEDEQWLRDAHRCVRWFLGENDCGVPLYDENTGGCRDGLMPDGANQNQGGESTLAWLIALLSLHEIVSRQNLSVALKPEYAELRKPTASAFVRTNGRVW